MVLCSNVRYSLSLSGPGGTTFEHRIVVAPVRNVDVVCTVLVATTTVRVRTSTRSALNALAERDGTSADEVINAGLEALDRERKRKKYEADARRVAADPEDRAEVAAALRDLLGE